MSGCADAMCCESARRSRTCWCCKPMRCARRSGTGPKRRRAACRSSCCFRSRSASCPRCCWCSSARPCSHSFDRTHDRPVSHPACVARIFPDISPHRASRDYRLLWLGQLVSQAGSALRLVAIPYQVYVLTGSSLAVGLIGLFSAIPLMALSLFGGVIADRTDRRRLLLITQVFLALTSFALALATQLGLASVALLYALTAVGAGFGALDAPARSSLAPMLRDERVTEVM